MYRSIALDNVSIWKWPLSFARKFVFLLRDYWNIAVNYFTFFSFNTRLYLWPCVSQIRSRSRAYMSVTSGANNRPNFLLQEVCEIWSLSNVGLFTQHTECFWLQFLSTWVSDKCLVHVSVTSGVNFMLSDLKSYRAAFRLFHKIAKRDYYLRHVCTSVRPHGKIRLPLDGFSWNLIFIFWKSVEKIQILMFCWPRISVYLS